MRNKIIIIIIIIRSIREKGTNLDQGGSKKIFGFLLRLSFAGSKEGVFLFSSFRPVKIWDSFLINMNIPILLRG